MRGVGPKLGKLRSSAVAAAGGEIGMRFVDGYTGDNDNGSPSPTWRLEQAGCATPPGDLEGCGVACCAVRRCVVRGVAAGQLFRPFLH